MAWCGKQLLSNDECEALGATSAVRLELESPADLPTGEFRGVLYLDLHAEGDLSDQAKTLELPVSGHVRGQWAVFGPAIEADTGVIKMGVTNRRGSLTKRLAVRLRDAEPPAADAFQIKAEPSLLKVTLTERKGSDTSGGLYYLDVQVPEGSPESTY